MDSAASKISELQLSQFRSVRNCDQLEIKHAELLNEVKFQQEKAEQGKETLSVIKEQNIELKGALQEHRKFKMLERKLVTCQQNCSGSGWNRDKK